MNTHERDERWIAYYLGDLPESERAAVEAELADHSAEAAKMEQVVERLRSWANEPTIYEPVDVHGIHRAGPAKSPGALRWLRLPATLAAAALLIIALGQVRFSVTFGDSTFAWGMQPEPAVTEGDLSPFEERLASIEEKQESAAGLIEAVALQTVEVREELRDTAATLAANQQAEAQARYRDVQQLLSLTSGTDMYTYAMER